MDIECTHKTLSFGSGAFYIFCLGCGVSWVAVKSGNDVSLDYNRGGQNLSGQQRGEINVPKS